MTETATSPPASDRDDQISLGDHSVTQLTSWSPRQRSGYCDGDEDVRIGVLGSYSGLNVGDEAILRCVLGCLRHLRPHAKIVVFSRNDEHTRQHHPEACEVVSWEGSSRCELLAAVSRLNLLIMGGLRHEAM